MDKNEKVTVKQLLKAYNLYKRRVEILEERLKDLEEEDGIRGVSYDGIFTKTNKQGSVVERTVAYKLNKKQTIEKEIKAYCYYMKEVDLALKGLRSFTAEVIKMKYIEGKGWFEVAEIVGYSEVHCRKEAAKGIKVLAVELEDFAMCL